jgi:hypothetical protein
LIHGNFFIIIIIISHNDQCNFAFFKSKMKRDLFSNSFTQFFPFLSLTKYVNDQPFLVIFEKIKIIFTCIIFFSQLAIQ